MTTASSAKTNAVFKKAVAAHLQGDHKAARKLYLDLLRINPDHAPALSNLGAIHIRNMDWPAALRCLEEAVKRAPRNSDAWNNLGVTLLETGDAHKALSCFKTAMEAAPADPEIHTNLGAALRALGDLASAQSCHLKAIELNPSCAKAYNHLALVRKDMGDLEQAVLLFEKALRLNPEEEKFAFNLCETLVEKGALAEAVSFSLQALEKHPASITTAVGAARVFIECGQWEKAEPLIRKAVVHPFTAADLGILRHLLLFLNASLLPRQTIARIHLRCGELLFRERSRGIEGKPFDFGGRYEGLERIRIGYISPDFNRHSVGWFFRELVENHDTGRFEVYCYSLSDRRDDITEAIEARSGTFRQVKTMTELQIAGQVFEDRIMILVDLAGYTRENRLDIFAFRPAPVQVTAIGYPHGTGLPTMDYRITDTFSEGPSPEEEYRETLVRLERFFLPLPSLEAREPQITREQLGIEPDRVVLVSFNAFHKLRPEVLQLWDRILREVPQAHLLLSFRHAASAYARERILSHFRVSPGRLHFLDPAQTEEEHRGRYRLADLALDPFPYSGTTSSWEALSMGVPTITLKGERHVQRTTWSLLKHLGFSFLAADDDDSYLGIATNLLRDPDQLKALHDQIRQRVDEINAIGSRPYVSELENQYLTLWQAYCSSSQTR
jgi:protein O-GlcNAc transferase